jgi:hypothetical protein
VRSTLVVSIQRRAERLADWHPLAGSWETSAALDTVHHSRELGPTRTLYPCSPISRLSLLSSLEPKADPSLARQIRVLRRRYRAESNAQRSSRHRVDLGSLELRRYTLLPPWPEALRVHLSRIEVRSSRPPSPPMKY